MKLTRRDYLVAVGFAAVLSLACCFGPPHYSFTVREFLIGFACLFVTILLILKDERTIHAAR